MRINRLPPALQALLIAAAIEIPCAALLEKAGNDIHNAVETILAILHMPTILFMLIVILPLKSYVVPDVLDSIWKIGAFLLQGMLIALLAFLILECEVNGADARSRIGYKATKLRKSHGKQSREVKLSKGPRDPKRQRSMPPQSHARSGGED